ncbi:hypothetical protein BCR32DRAFT_247656 [Anaeromyces robustus]|uniref:Uncharacterized protein n=1 Tax=Anaeromyces robustus TaxID=1754192 RepID=A0A1Y1WX69_9FUNG|nr:hypothetical protein BCR32DRAFT_247656 [Anaeromyces robustus]|eukprot:ORX77806.1 hypothetical protein BCR32DRAFT_247656 [Anaeromyces robustus]
MENSTKVITFNRLPILGGDKISFDEWYFSFERWCKSNNIENNEKIEYLISLTTNTARTIVYNSLNKTIPDDYEEIIKNLKEHYRRSTSKNAKLLELSTITIRKDEKISDFDVRFNSLCNQIKLNLNDQVIASYYINAFRNWSKIYEALLEEEPSTLQEAMKITSKKGKIFDLLEENKNKNKNSLNIPRKIIGSRQSPNITKIATENEIESEYESNIEDEDPQNFIYAVQKRKTPNKPNNKSIVKPSILNEPKTKAVKQQKKLIKDARRRKISTSESSEQDINDTSMVEIEDEDTNKEPEPTITNNEKVESETVNNNKETEKQKPIRKRNMTSIQMLNENEKFSITEEANNLFPKISLSQLLSASPSLRKEFEQGCKPRITKLSKYFMIPVPT